MLYISGFWRGYTLRKVNISYKGNKTFAKA